MFRNQPYLNEVRLGPLIMNNSKMAVSGLVQYTPSEVLMQPGPPPDCLISCRNGLVSVEVDHSILMLVGTSTLTDIPLGSVRTLPHDLCCKYLWGQENKSNILNEVVWDGPVEGVCTPDWYSIENSKMYVVELKTRVWGGRKAYDEAMNQYGSVLSNCRLPAHSLGIVVSEESVIYSECLKIPEYMLKILVMLCRLGHHVQKYCSSRKWLRDYDYAHGATTIIIPDVAIPSDSPEKLNITLAMMQTWHELPRIPQPSTLINKNIAKITPSHLRKEVDLAMMNDLYLGGRSAAMQAPLRSGILAPLMDTADLPEPVQILNPILSSLLRDYHSRLEVSGGGAAKYVYIRDKLEKLAATSIEDISKGLWSTYFMEPDVEVFRSRVKTKEAPPNELPISSGSGLVSGICKNHVSPLLDAERKRKHDKIFRPTNIDMHDWSNVLMQDTGLPPFESRQNTRLDNSLAELPFTSELWYLHSSFWQRLVEELNVGRYSAKGTWNRFHVQKIEPFNAYLFTHGTGTDSHQFYYLLLRLDDKLSNPGPDFANVVGTSWWYTNCVQSMNASKMSQWLNLHERLISLRYFWKSVFHLEPKRGKTHFAASFLIGFDAKQGTIDTLALFRYLYMELCKERSHRNVYKIAQKMPPVLRTPVQAWILYSMQKLMRDSEGWSGVRVDEDDPSQMDFRNLQSWVDFKPIPSFSTILSLSYMHYVVPHPFSTGLQGRVAIMEKLLKEESTLPSNRHQIGWSSPPLESLRDHEFSVGFVKAMGYEAGKYLLSRYPQFREFWSEVSSKLRALTFSSFSTFKKSTVKNSKGEAVRDFCFETLADLADELNWDVGSSSRFCPFDHLNDLVWKAQVDASVRDVTIFVKDQQTGIREIFVLTMCMRLLVKFMEVICRVINTCLPNETLSVPSRKESLIYQHTRDVVYSKRALMQTITTNDHEIIVLRYSSSSDAKTWCQQFCMPTFGCFLDECLGQYGDESMALRKVLMLVLNLITNKHIHVDQRVKEWFRTHPDTIGTSETFNKLSELFNSKIEGLYEDDAIINKSNMMQGIPHETSSALHAAYLMIATSSLKQLVDGFSKARSLGALKFGRPVITNMVSSDDSGIMFSLPIAFSKADEEKAQLCISQVREVLSRAGYNIEDCKRYFSAKVSLEKSTIFAETPVYEFNSKFYVGASVNTAEIKFICSPLTLGYHTVLRERISEGLSSLSGCLREGVRQDQLDVLQLCLRRMHHRFLYVDWWRATTHESLDKLCCPVLGTMPLVPPGLIGFMNLQGLSDYTHLVKSHVTGYFDNYIGDYGIDHELSFSLSLNLVSRYQGMLQLLLPKHEALLSKYSETPEESLRFISKELFEDELVVLKLMSPGTRIAMSYVDIAKIHMASCYAATQPCIRMKGISCKISMTQAIMEVQKRQASTPPVIRECCNPMLELFNRLLLAAHRVPAVSEQARFPVHLPMLSEGSEIQRLGDVRRNLVDGWRYGFAGMRLRTLLWCQKYEPRIEIEFPQTLTNLEGNLRELDRIINALEERALTVHTLCFKPLNNTMTEKYASFLLSNFSRKFSMALGSQRFEPEPTPIEKHETRELINGMMELLSMEGTGWRLARITKHFRILVHSLVASNKPPSLEEWPSYPQEIMLRILDDDKRHQINLLNLRIRRNVRFFLDSSTGFIKNRTHWYKIFLRGGQWFLGRLAGSPILPHYDLQHIILEESDFYIYNADLKIDTSDLSDLRIKSNHWSSESWKAFPRAIYPRPWESTLYELNYHSINIERYCNYLPPPYDSEISKKITSIVFGCKRELRSWTFWEDLSRVKPENAGAGAHSLAYYLLKKVLPRWSYLAKESDTKSESAPQIIERVIDLDDLFQDVLGLDLNVWSLEQAEPDPAAPTQDELFSIDYCGANEYWADDNIMAGLMMKPKEGNAAGAVLRSSALEHATICFVNSAHHKTNDQGLFGPPKRLLTVLTEISGTGTVCELCGDFEPLHEPEHSLISEDEIL
uniref:RNA-directed RNA polymerase L n=1 Tax=Blechmonas ayalai leishbunyavirus 1 TaxID=2364197 RepID=A0A386IS94_9VIRU|nr:RNA-dependent RNA polymerase [Blechmonas ayalai leishbunyavirus 1]